MNFGVLFWEQNFSTRDISHICRSATKFGRIKGLANRNLLPEFRELWPGGSRDTMRRHGMHQSVTDALAKWFFDNFPMFVESFSVVSIHYVAPELGASFLYRYPTSRGSSLRQHGFHVSHCHSVVSSVDLIE